MDAGYAAGLPRALADRARDALLAGEPDIGRLHADLMRDMGFPAERATRIIYGLALRLNASSFPPITHLELIHAEGCDLACAYCPEKDTPGRARMPPEVARAALDLLFDYSRDEPLVRVTHSGGEPTQSFDGIRAATEHAEQRAAALGKSLELDMTTSGVLLNDRMVSYLGDHRIRVVLSIDGLEESHDRYRVDGRGRGTFRQALAGLALLKTQQPWIGVRMTVMPRNARALYEDVRGLYDLGANHFVIGRAAGAEWPPEAAAALEEQLGRLHRWYEERRRGDLRIDAFEEGDAGARSGGSSVAATARGEIVPGSHVTGFGRERAAAKLGDVAHGLTHLRSRLDLVRRAGLRAGLTDSR